MQTETQDRKIGSLSKLSAYLHFMWAGVVRQSQTGGIVPSQRFLIDQMISPVPQDYPGRVIELGAGTGALTVRLAARCPKATILACDLNPNLARTNRELVRRAGLEGRVEVVARSAESLLSEIARRGSEKPDFIISGIPLGYLSAEEVRALVEIIERALARDGMYIQFQHSLLSRRIIRARFPRLHTTPVWLNFPPAVIYYARR